MPDEPLTDYGNARRLVAAYGGNLRYVPRWSRWLVWDGRRWGPDETGQADRCAKAVGRSVLRHAFSISDHDEQRRWLRAHRHAESAYGVQGTLRLAGTEHLLAVRPQDLDAHPWLLNCENGVLDLRQTESLLMPHDPSLLLTKLAGAPYLPAAACPRFDEFLRDIQPEEEARDFLGRLFGQALIGEVTEQVLPILNGNGANGKSTLVEVMMAVFGDYAIAADPDLLIDCGDRHPTGVADLFGRRLAVTHETDHGRNLAEAAESHYREIKRELAGGELDGVGPVAGGLPYEQPVG